MITINKPEQSLFDPLALAERAMSRFYTWWLRYTFPFAAVGSDFWAHYSADLARGGAPYMKFGSGVAIDRDVWLNVPSIPEDGQPVIVIDDGVRIGRRCMISAKNRVHIGHDVIFGPSVLITDHLHAFEDVTMPITHQGITEGGTVHIEDGCWIGFGAAILCGKGELVIGRNCVLGANSVVTRSLPPYSVVVGNPARVVKQFDPAKGKWVLGAAKPSSPAKEKPAQAFESTEV